MRRNAFNFQIIRPSIKVLCEKFVFTLIYKLQFNLQILVFKYMGTGQSSSLKREIIAVTLTP